MREYVRLGGVLFIICAVVALLLAVGNYVTKDKISAMSEKKTSEAQLAVLQGVGKLSESDGETPVLIEGSSVKTITRWKTESGKTVFAVACSPKGYGGEISMMVGVDENLKVTGVSIIDNSKETPGLGLRVSEPKFYEQFIGKTKGVGVTKNATKGNKTDAVTGATKSSKAVTKGNEVEAITGATISSRAVAKGVSDAISAVEEVGK